MNARRHQPLTTMAAVLAIAISLSLAQNTKADDETRITTEEAFREAIVGKKISNESGYSLLHEDGRMTGNFSGRELTGTWSWEDEHFCRSGKLGKKKLARDCQVIVVSGEDATFIRKRGKGKQNIFRMHRAE